jgi:hypothetical protein
MIGLGQVYAPPANQRCPPTRTIACRLGLIEHARKEPIEGHLSSETLQINSITTRPFVTSER